MPPWGVPFSSSRRLDLSLWNFTLACLTVLQVYSPGARRAASCPRSPFPTSAVSMACGLASSNAFSRSWEMMTVGGRWLATHTLLLSLLKLLYGRIYGADIPTRASKSITCQYECI